MARTLVAVCIVALIPGAPCFAQEWAQEMFAESTHDFGAVARSAKTEHRFVLTNLYADDLHISGVRSSCGCTTPRIEKETISTYEQGAIIAHVNSDRFLGQNGATITVTFDKPQYAEVELRVRVFIQSDVIFDPTSVMFGLVDQGREAQKKVSIGHAARGDWQLKEVKSSWPHLTGRISEVSREDGKAFYELTARLAKTAPPGQIRSHLILVTNDPQPEHIPILVEGHVVAPVSANPQELFFGVVAPGQTVTKSVVLRSKKPFRVTSITPECACLQAKSPTAKEAKTLHLIPITFTASQETGKVAKSVRILTDLDKTAVEFSAYAAVTTR